MEKGKPQKLVIRGHTSLWLVGSNSSCEDNYELAYRRCHQTMKFLVAMGIDPRRMRFSIAAANEPRFSGTDPDRQNPRVEVFLLSDVVNDLVGNADNDSSRRSQASIVAVNPHHKQEPQIWPNSKIHKPGKMLAHPRNQLAKVPRSRES